MKRWDAGQMREVGEKLFDKIYRQKYHAHHNHESHFMARDIDEWLPQGIQAILQGTYDPRCLKRYYFSDEVVDQLHLSDRIFQHALLKQLKPTFKHVMNPNVFHLAGPTGVRYATQRIITNPIDAPRGYKNPIKGIALRGPLSQFFSGIYLKPLDDVFINTSVHYFRFQDDVLILCKTKRAMNHCRRRLMEVLSERQLTLSRKKSRMGSIESGFHFLGVDYSPTQTENISKVTPKNDVQYLDENGGTAISEHQNNVALNMVPHARTLRKARMHVQQMVTIRLSTKRIRRYLHHFLLWWVKTSEIWTYQELVIWFVETCWDIRPAAHAAGVLKRYINTLDMPTSLGEYSAA